MDEFIYRPTQNRSLRQNEPLPSHFKVFLFLDYRLRSLDSEYSEMIQNNSFRYPSISHHLKLKHKNLSSTSKSILAPF